MFAKHIQGMRLILLVISVAIYVHAKSHSFRLFGTINFLRFKFLVDSLLLINKLVGHGLKPTTVRAAFDATIISKRIERSCPVQAPSKCNVCLMDLLVGRRERRSVPSDNCRGCQRSRKNSMALASERVLLPSDAVADGCSKRQRRRRQQQ